jgi:FkbM family methyltransferase
MNLVSYAQNQEDIVLYRALRDIDNGFYIDVGAQHPVTDSVTRLFYERGWHGINIDPVPQWFDLLSKDRPHDVNLRLAVGSAAGREKFYAVAGTGLSTADASLVDQYAEAGYAAEELDVEIRTLDDICAEHHVSTVHFLKVDVEGAEEDVLRGFSFKQIRPWVVLVEAVAPVAMREGDDAHAAIETHAGWEPILLGHGYEHVYSDGLNRFYVAKEHHELKARMQTQANPLDAFVRHHELLKHERILELDEQIHELTNMAQVVDQRHQIQEFLGLAETAENRLRRIAELEQDNARLIGQASALQLGATELKDTHNRVALLVQQTVDLSGRLELTAQRAVGLQDRLDKMGAEYTQLSVRLSAAEHDARELSTARLEIGELCQLNAILDERISVLGRNDQELRSELAEQSVNQAELRRERDELHAAVQQMLNSRSSRFIVRLRDWRKKFDSPAQAKAEPVEARNQRKSLPRRMGSSFLMACIRFARRHPRLHAWAGHIYRRIPMVDRHLVAFVQHNVPRARTIAPVTYDSSYAAPVAGDLDSPPELAETHRRIRRVIADQQRPKA